MYNVCLHGEITCTIIQKITYIYDRQLTNLLYLNDSENISKIPVNTSTLHKADHRITITIVNTLYTNFSLLHIYT